MMACGCNHKTSRGRTLCPEAKRLQDGMRAAHETEKELRAEHGSPAHPEAQQAMRDRLAWKQEFFGHLKEVERRARGEAAA